MIATENNATVFGIQYGGQLFYSNNLNDAIKYGKASNNDAQINLGAGVGWVNDVWVLKSEVSSIILSDMSSETTSDKSSTIISETTSDTSSTIISETTSNTL
jgi:hypothetical protein